MKPMRGPLLTQKVNFVIGVCCLGSVALLAITAIFRAAEMEDPIASAMVQSGLADLQ